MRPLQQVLLTLWAGGLWTICAVAAPSAFAVLERSAAGSLVGRLFTIAAWGGAAIALFALSAPRDVRLTERLSRILIIVAGVTPLTSEIVLGPMMRAARLAGDLQSFALLHGLSALLFLAACLSLLILIVRLNRAA